MDIYNILALIGALLFISVVLSIIFKYKNDAYKPWIFPLCISIVFFLYSFFTIFTEGPTGFWFEHTRNFWGNQIWFDLLIAIAIAWFFIAPRANKVKMNLLFWLFLTLTTGTIGLLAMVSRLLYLENRKNNLE